MSANRTTYRHTQRAPLCVLLYGLAWISGLVAVLTVPDLPRGAFLVATLLPLTVGCVLGPAFHYLRVQDEGEHLRVGFGPLPLFKTSIPYSEITEVAVDRTTWLDGWGIHMSVRGGWVWNIWGWECVKITRSNRVIRIGTNDPVRLAEFLQTRCPKLTNSQSA